jgi:hypothetical protein
MSGWCGHAADSVAKRHFRACRSDVFRGAERVKAHGRVDDLRLLAWSESSGRYSSGSKWVTRSL